MNNLKDKEIKKIIYLRKNIHAFTLIELLAVIIILGILMIIAIPAVTNYINNSRKEAYVKTAKQVISGARNLVNSGKLDMYDTDTTYYIPSSCIRVENGNEATSPYGKFEQAYVVAVYTGNDYDYYWTSVDESKIGIELVSYDELSKDDVKESLNEIYPTILIPGSSNIVVLDEDNCSTFGKYTPKPEGLLRDKIITDANVREYTGEHQDSFTEEGTEKIYYFYSSDIIKSLSIEEHMNVLFANHCWQILRTTDTGGIKLLYNGAPTSDGKCGYNARYIGNSSFTNSTYSPADVGYMYNTKYSFGVKEDWKKTKTLNTSSASLSSDFYVADNVNVINNYSYSLVNPVPLSTYSNKQDLIGKYTFLGTKTTNSRAYYIVAVEQNTIYILTLTLGKTIEDVDRTIVFGNSIEDSNNDNIYELKNLTNVKISEWGKHRNELIGKYTCDGEETTCAKPLYITSASNHYYYVYDIVDDNYVFSSNVKRNSNGKYELIGTKNHYFKYNDTIDGLTQTHYTCFNTSGICDNLYYVYQTYDKIYYLNITGASNIDSALNEMLERDDVNRYDSLIKTKLETWYEQNLSSYSNYLEDSIFHACRDIKSKSSGWETNGNPKTSYMFNYLVFDYQNLKCANDVDKYSVSNSKAKIKFPIGLPTYQELNIRGVFNFSTGFLTMSPAQFRDNVAVLWYCKHSVTWGETGSKAIRPVISLKPGTGYLRGDGSKDNPYVI